MLEREKMDTFKGKHLPSSNMDTFEYFRWMIKQAIEQGEVDPSVDVELGAFREDPGKDRQAVIRHGIRIAENGIRIRGKHLGEFTTPTPKEQND